MDRDTLLKRVNKFARANGYRSVTPAKLFDLTKEELIDGPDRAPTIGARGSRRNWSETTSRQVMEVLRLEKLGIRRRSDQRTQMWLDGQDGPRRKTRPSILSEWRRRTKELVRPLRASGALTLIRQMGMSDPRLAIAAASLKAEHRLAVLEVTRFTTVSERHVSERTSNRFLREALKRLGMPTWLEGSQFDSEVDCMVAGLGVIAENSLPALDGTGEFAIVHSPSQLMINARAVTQVMPWLLANMMDFFAAIEPIESARFQALKPAYCTVAGSIRLNPWRLLMLVMAIHWFKRIKGEGSALAYVAREVVPHIQRLVEHCALDKVVTSSLNSDNPTAFIALLMRPLLIPSEEETPLPPRQALFRIARRLWPHGLRELCQMRYRAGTRGGSRTQLV